MAKESYRKLETDKKRNGWLETAKDDNKRPRMSTKGYR